MSDNMVTLKTRDWKSRDWKTRDEMTGVENAGLENARPTKYGKPTITLSAVYIVNDNTIKMCLRRFDDNSYTLCSFCEQWVTGAHSSKLCDGPTDSDSDTSSDEEQPDADASTNAVIATVATPDSDMNDCNVGTLYLVALSHFVTCCHQRFCEACAKDVERQGRGCPICGTDIQMILCLFWRSFEIGLR